MKGRWAAGIPPRFFAWVIRDRLAVSERPGGYARNHRRVRRQEEIIWLRENGFTRVVSLLGSPHNLHAYDELELTWSQLPFPPGGEARTFLPELYHQLDGWLEAGERVLVHQEELGDRLTGVVAGYLLWSDKLGNGAQAIAAVEQMTRRPMGPPGRELVAVVPELSGRGGRPGPGAPSGGGLGGASGAASGGASGAGGAGPG